MIRSVRGLSIVAVVTILVALVVKLPARVAYNWLAPADLVLSGLHGTVWNGQADAGNARGVYLKDLKWRIKPLQLFTGKAAYRVEATPQAGFLETDVALGFGGSLAFANLTASLPLAPLAGPLRIRGLQGNASLRFDRIALRQALPVEADGALEVSGLLLPRLARTPIGGYRAEFFTQETGIAASVEDTDGVIDIAGSLQLNQDGSYQFLAQVVAKDGAPESVRRQLQYLPPANDRGQQELRVEGSL